MNIPATWRGEPVRIVSQQGAKLQIARVGIGLRWVAAATVIVTEGEHDHAELKN